MGRWMLVGGGDFHSARCYMQDTLGWKIARTGLVNYEATTNSLRTSREQGVGGANSPDRCFSSWYDRAGMSASNERGAIRDGWMINVGEWFLRGFRDKSRCHLALGER